MTCPSTALGEIIHLPDTKRSEIFQNIVWKKAKMFNLCQIKVCTEQQYILPTSTHGIYMEKFNTFLRLVKTVLVPYLKTGHDSIQMLFFLFYLHINLL